MSEIDVRIGVDVNSKPLGKLKKDLRGIGGAADFAKLKIAAATYSIYRLGKASVIAAAQAEKLDATFAATLRNMQMGNMAEELLGYIDRVSLATGVLDTDLIPAFSRLISTTKNVQASQALLNTAIDTSAATGKDLGSVVTTLTKAMEGQRKGLGTLGLGIDSATLKTMDLQQVVTALNEAYAGTAAASAQTYAGQLDRLRIAGQLAKETLGKSFLDALDLSGSELRDLTTFAGKAAGAFGWLTGKVASFVSTTVSGLRNVRDYFMSDPMFKWIMDKLGKGGIPIYTQNPNLRAGTQKSPEVKANEALMKVLAKMDRDAKRRTQVANAAARAKAAQDKKQKELQQQTNELVKQFDIERISIAAALARQQDASTQARLQALMKLNDLQYMELDTLEKMDDELEKLKELQDKLTGSATSTAAAVQKIYEAYKLTADEAKRLSDIYTTSMVANQAPTAAAFRAAESLASGGIALSGGPITAGSGAATIPTATTPTVAPVTVNINALSTMDIEEAVAAAVNSGSRAGLAYTQVFSRL